MVGCFRRCVRGHRDSEARRDSSDRGPRMGDCWKAEPSMTDAYHLKELAIARDAADRRHVNPPAFPPEWRVLDVGCGAGQTLIACFGDRRSVGVDIAMDALRLGRTLTDKVSFVRAAAENLPFSDGAFDAVIARVSLPYSNLGHSLR